MNYGKVQICGVDTARLTVMREEEKMRLIELAQKGDIAARARLVDGNLRLVLSVIQRFMNRKEPPDDLFQVGCIGLIKAIDNFDLSLGVRFSTYAVPMIIGELRRYMRDSAPIRVSRSVRDLAYRSMQAREELQNLCGREPTISEIAKRLGVDSCDVVIALESAVDPISIYEPVFSDGEDGLMIYDQIRDGDCEQNWITEMGLKQALKSLSPREREVLTQRYLCGKTQVDVAAGIGISQAQVSRLEKNALTKIKAML